jgi:hypothetical protein
MSPDRITAVYEQQDKTRKDADRAHLWAAIQEFKADGRRREFKVAMVAIAEEERRRDLVKKKSASSSCLKARR